MNEICSVINNLYRRYTHQNKGSLTAAEDEDGERMRMRVICHGKHLQNFTSLHFLSGNTKSTLYYPHHNARERRLFYQHRKKREFIRYNPLDDASLDEEDLYACSNEKAVNYCYKPQQQARSKESNYGSRIGM